MTTQWDHPVTGKKKIVTGDLPFGWERKITEDGTIYFVDHENQKTTYTDPRLAFAEATDDSNVKKGYRQRYDGNSSALHVLSGRDLSQKYVIVTGASSGIGYETARSLAFHGAHVVMACRDVAKGEKCLQAILAERSLAKVTVMKLNLASFKSVEEFSEEYKKKQWPLHILILNAAVFGLPYTQTEDDFETTFQVNYLSHFYLTKLLWDILMKSSPSRAITVSSESHRQANLNMNNLTEDYLSPTNASTYWDLQAYNLSKLCNILFALRLNTLLSDCGVLAVSCHPGNMIYTNLQSNWWFYKLLFYLVRPFTKSLQQGAATSVYCAVAPEVKFFGGMYFNNCCRCPTTNTGCDDQLAKALWDISERMLTKRIGRLI